MSGDNEELPHWTSTWRYMPVLGIVIFCWMGLVCWLAYMLLSRADIAEETDRAGLREWLDESRIFRKSLPELVKEYLEFMDPKEPSTADAEAIRFKREEILEQLHALMSPLYVYQNQLPLFPEIYQIDIRFQPDGIEEIPPIQWQSSVIPPRGSDPESLGHLEYAFGNDNRATIACSYRLHAYNSWQLIEQRRRTYSLVAVGLIVTAGLGAGLWVTKYVRDERTRQWGELAAARTIEGQTRKILEQEIESREAEKEREKLHLDLLEQRLQAAKQESIAQEAERKAYVLQTELYAQIGIMAGSYAHNIKNLLVRPNDLLVRCLEGETLPPEQTTMLHEVQQTLGTVTERLQEILRTVRRDPTQSAMQRLDLRNIVRDLESAWSPVARDKWRMQLKAELTADPQWIRGDLSHLQQAIENLIFNARDATFEQRNALREQVRQQTSGDPIARKRALIESASWQGIVTMRVHLEGDRVVLEVRDNGIGMSEEVRLRCLDTHFTTKRGNAVFEGFHSGMGLGLSFVTTTLQQHHAELTIESQAHEGAIFRVRFPHHREGA